MTWEEENDLMLFNSMNEFLQACTSPDKARLEGFGLELYISGICNQKCTYCYLTNFHEQLYPLEYENQEQILKNLNIFLNYLEEKKYIPFSIDLFSGEIWHTDFGLKILLTLLEFIRKNPNKVKSIMIPSNCSFVTNDEQVTKIDAIISAFELENCYLKFSCSYDGLILDRINRPQIDPNNNDYKEDKKFIDKLFKWCKKHQYGFHPMIAAANIELQKENYDWWIEQFDKYDFSFNNDIMMLEVRNSDWTQERILKYIEFLNHAINQRAKHHYNNNLEEILHAGLGIYEDPTPHNYNNLELGTTYSGFGCSIDRMFILRLGDLAWAPCHRTSYEKLLYGRLKVENKKIVGIKALNVPLFSSIHTLGFKGHLKCDNCPIANICTRGCAGSQFEYSKEIFYPIPCVCDLFKAKNIFLYLKYTQMLNQLPNKKEFIGYGKYNYMSKLILSLPKEEFDKWEKLITPLITND